MKAFLFVTAIAVVLGMVSSAGIYLCTGESFTGACTTYVVQAGACFTFPALHRVPSSGRAVAPSTSCLMYGNSNCNPNYYSLTMDREGYGRLGNIHESAICN